MNIEEHLQSLQRQIDQLRVQLETLNEKSTETVLFEQPIPTEQPRSPAPPTPPAPPVPAKHPSDIVRELLGQLDKTKAVDAGAIIGGAWRSQRGTLSYLSTENNFESWRKVPDGYVEKIVSPFSHPQSLTILRSFLDGKRKQREELQAACGIGEGELDTLLLKLMEVRYIESETKVSVKGETAVKQEMFSLGQRGKELLLVVLWKADEQRKFEEDGEH